jgi:hypothetical protein
VTLPKTKEVLGVVELYENILSFLRPKEIISCRRVSTTFRNDIDASSLLQGLMFLRTTHVPQQAWRLARKINGHGQGLTGVRPVFRLHPPSAYWSPEFFASSKVPNRIRKPAILNPTFHPSPLFGSRERNPNAYHNCVDCDHIILSPNHPELTNFQIQDFKPNWTLLDMFLTNPPCREAWITFEAISLPRRYSRFSWSGFLQVATGITIRDLLNARSVIRGVGILWRPEPSGQVAWGSPRNVTLTEMHKYENREDPFELYGDLRCDFLDTIIPTGRMWAGVVPYVETGGESKYSPEKDHSWKSSSNESSDEEDDEDADGESDSEGADDEEARGEEAEAKKLRAKRLRAKKRSAKRRRAKKRSAKRRTKK